MSDKYTKPRAVRLGELDKDVEIFMEKSNIKFPELVKKSLSEYLKNNSPSDLKKVAEFSQELKKMRVDLSKVGGNLNQLAFYFNTTGIVHEKGLAETHENLRVEFKKLAQLFRKIEQLTGV